MNDTPDNAPKFAKNNLQRLGHTKDATRRWAWGLLVVAGVLEIMVCAALVDYWLLLTASGRAIGFLLLTALAAAGVGGWLRLRRRPTRLKEAALDVEAQRPQAGCVVSTAAEYLSGERQITHQYEPELVAALEAQAARHLEKAHVSYARKVGWPAWLFVFACLTLLVFWVFVPTAATALKRTVAPWSKTAYTQVEVKPGSVEIPVGKSVAITNTFTGRVPQNAVLRWQDAAHPAWQTVSLKPNSNGLYLHGFTSLQQSVTYQVTGSDAVSPPYQITTYIPPEIRELRLRVNYPAYTRVPPFEPPVPEDLKVLRASQLEFQVATSTNTTQARLRFAALPEMVELRAGPGHQWTARVQATNDTDYWIELADAQGHKGGNEPPYHLKVFPDQPPTVAILEPGQDLRAEPTNTIPVTISARDDFGVTDVKLVYHKLGGPEQAVACTQTNRENGEVTARASLDLSTLNLREYELVAYHAEALDNNTLDGPGKGASPVYFIEITNEENPKGKPKPKDQGQKVNLLVIQKQIVADTTALAANAPADQFQELSDRQKEAADFARLYSDALNQAGAAGEAAQLMDQAIKDMNAAETALTQRSRSEALPPEENALAKLYQVIKNKPELQDLPTQPPPESEQQPQEQEQQQDQVVNVVLEAIKKQAKEPPSNEEIAKALEEAKRLSQAQAGVNQALERPGHADAQSDPQASEQSASASGSKERDKPSPAAAKAGQDAKSQAAAKAGPSSKSQAGEKPEPNAQAQAGAKSEERAQTQGGAKSEENSQAQSSGKPEDNAQANGGSKSEETSQASAAGAGPAPKAGQSESEAQALAQLEEQLSREAAALAEKLAKLAGKDARLGHNAGQRMDQAAGQMAAAAQALRQGRPAQAGTAGAQGRIQVDKVVALLQRLLKDQPNLTDVTAEDFPKEYEALISEYLKKLSYEQ